MVLPIDWGSYESDYSSTSLKLEVLASASSCLQYTGTFNFYNISLSSSYKEAYAKQIKHLNRSDEIESVILYPGVEYIATTGMGSNWIASDKPGALQAFVLDSGKKTQELAIHAELSLTAASAGAALFLSLLLILGFVLLYIHQEPRALLPKGEH